jgi:signal transduction histidine kinase/DNA-binding response OmpR family regulator
MIESIVNLSSFSLMQNKEGPIAEPESVNILVVDDLAEKLLAYEAILEGLGQKVVTVRSGEEALKCILREEFAVILLDVNMPGMDGFETASLIRSRKKSAHTPIIFLTAFTDEIRMAQGYASGAVDYLPTPVVPEILQAKVRVFIELSQMRRKAASQASERALRNAAEESARRSELLAVASAILARSKNQAEIIREMIKIPIPYLADISLIVLTESSESQPLGIEQAYVTREGMLHSEALMNPITAFPWIQKALKNVTLTGQFQYSLKVPALAFTPDDTILSDFQSHPTSLYPYGAVLVLPLMIRGTTSGMLILARRDSEATYNSEHISLANDLASRISVSLENTMLVERIQEADQRKDEFLAMLAHELRNPLAPISNSLQIMKLSSDSVLHKQAEETIERQMQHMVHLVDDLTDVSRITKGKIELRKERRTFKDLLAHGVETAQPLIKQKGHALTIELPEEDIWLDADPARISQIFSNLLNNAAKYTDKGGHIKITVRLSDDWVNIIITDNGIGIAPHMLLRIFDMFSQVDSSLERTQGGLGIGLTLVKSLIEMHEGSIVARSKGLEQGSEFVLRFPVATPPDMHPSADIQLDPANASASLRVLVVDDNEASAKTLGWMMEAFGHEIRIAHDGASAIELAKTYCPEIVLLDIGLPKMNGYEVCKLMQTDPLLKDTIFIAQTGWGQAEHRERSKEAGFNHHLVKPIDMKTLEGLLSKLITSKKL